MRWDTIESPGDHSHYVNQICKVGGPLLPGLDWAPGILCVHCSSQLAEQPVFHRASKASRAFGLGERAHLLSCKACAHCWAFISPPP